MLIKKTKNYLTYLLVSFVLFFFFLGFFLWMEKAESKFAITYEVQEKDSTMHVVVNNSSWFGQEPVFTWINGSSGQAWIKVEGARYHATSSTVSLPHYPAPQQALASYPKASVLVIASTIQSEYDWDEAQFHTFVKDSIPLPVVSLVGSKDAFFGREGLYSVKRDDPTKVNPEHIIHFELLDTEGTHIASAAVKAHVAGKATKRLPMKSLDLHFEGSPINSQDIFDAIEPKEIASLRLRSAGNDFMLAYMRDVVVSQLTKQTYLTPLAYQPVAVFINGEYWGIQYLREHITEKNILAAYPHLTREQLVLGELYENRSISNTNGFDYKMEKLMEFIETEDLNLPENYDQLTQLLNLDIFIDYIIVQTFISNTDWPHNNVKGVFLDDQLHFLLYDTDISFNYQFFYKNHTDDIFNMPDWYHALKAKNHNYFSDLNHHLPSHVGRIYSVLAQHDVFRERFMSRYVELLESNLSQSQIENAVAEIKSQIEPLIPSHIARWGYPKSMDDWHLHTEQIVDFCVERRIHVLDQLKQLEQIFARTN